MQRLQFVRDHLQVFADPPDGVFQRIGQLVYPPQVPGRKLILRQDFGQAFVVFAEIGDGLLQGFSGLALEVLDTLVGQCSRGGDQ